MPICTDTVEFWDIGTNTDYSFGQYFTLIPQDICIVEIGYDCSQLPPQYVFLCDATTTQHAQLDVYDPSGAPSYGYYGLGPGTNLIQIPNGGIDVAAGSEVVVLGHVDLASPVGGVSSFTPYCTPSMPGPPFVYNIEGTPVDQYLFFSDPSLSTTAPAASFFYSPSDAIIGIVNVRYTLGCCGGCGK